MNGFTAMSGALAARKIAPAGPGLLWNLRNLPNLWRGAWRILIAHLLGLPFFYGELRVRLFKADGRVIDYGLVSLRCVTTAFVNHMVDALVASDANWYLYKYHDSGTGVGGEVVGDVGLGTPWGGARTVGTQIEGASTWIYKSVATTAYNNTFAFTEHGLFNAVHQGPA